MRAAQRKKLPQFMPKPDDVCHFTSSDQIIEYLLEWAEWKKWRRDISRGQDGNELIRFSASEILRLMTELKKLLKEEGANEAH
tara:strand:+ start:1365 stop:1613 length:249 start_codon:yes stop_codon:yes gene_type:complete